MCKNKKWNANNVKQEDRIEELFNLEPLQLNFIKQYSVELLLESKCIVFQINTGSGISATATSLVCVNGPKKIKC